MPDGLYRYMTLPGLESSVTSVFLILSRKPENYKVKDELWEYPPDLARHLPRCAAQADLPRAQPRSSVGRWVIRMGYRVANLVVGFN